LPRHCGGERFTPGFRSSFLAFQFPAGLFSDERKKFKGKDRM